MADALVSESQCPEVVRSYCQAIHNLKTSGTVVDRLSFRFEQRERLRMKIQDYMTDRHSICHPKAANKVLGANGDRAAASTRIELTETPPPHHNILIPLPSNHPAAALVPVLSQAHPLMLNARGGVISKLERRCRENVQLNNFDLFAGHLSFAITRPNLAPSLPSFKPATGFTGDRYSLLARQEHASAVTAPSERTRKNAVLGIAIPVFMCEPVCTPRNAGANPKFCDAVLLQRLRPSSSLHPTDELVYIRPPMPRSVSRLLCFNDFLGWVGSEKMWTEAVVSSQLPPLGTGHRTF